MGQFLSNTYRLGVKELWSLWRDRTMLVLIVYVFTLGVYTGATAMPETLHNAPIAVVDEDQSPLSQRIISALYPPQFSKPQLIEWPEMDVGMDEGRYTFVMVIPRNFQRDLLAGRAPQIQLNVDATRMSQAFVGSGYVQQIVNGEISEFAQRYRSSAVPVVDLALRARFNPALEPSWSGSLAEIIDYIAMLSIVLAGAALIREREHGTVEHLLVMPVTPAQIMLAKVWSMGAVVLLAAAVSIGFVVQGLLDVPIAGSLPLFFVGAALCLFATTSMGIFLATLARNMPQFGMLMMLTIMPLQMLSGGATPRESMPELVQNIMLVAPTTHFVQLGQAILFRGAGLAVVWPQFAALLLIGAVLFGLSLQRFRKTIARMA
ncbi:MULTISPECIES: ABC transporter permease [Pseudomonadota]|jgi:ABC-2 type transport system permease protein|uniref:ABC transporter permease n=1 Tax=Pseudomonadota TaxID=1224 RepID=UPI00053DDFF6|nr:MULTISPECIES: ABC transporter permease [Pseudomonadota]PZP59305.1 MAG: ABC transporter permease [Pseudoxanthomonas spadix]PZU77783.1 MAG: ABC transporter permease [Rhizobium sp.]HBP04170.1 ABC transporter permease [Stenotrophomonas sp.]EIU2642107.1 ABC transporter permease [Pseudomonas aeruginosa]EIU9543616.1 ABC transporter permease [Pseudomonas aeruginosa]